MAVSTCGINRDDKSTECSMALIAYMSLLGQQLQNHDFNEYSNFVIMLCKTIVWIAAKVLGNWWTIWQPMGILDRIIKTKGTLKNAL